jgi:hypothetical protein
MIKKHLRHFGIAALFLDVANEIVPGFRHRLDRTHPHPLRSLPAVMWLIRRAAPRASVPLASFVSPRKSC